MAIFPAMAQEDPPISHRLYVTSNTGNSDETAVLEAIASMAANEQHSSVLLLGNFTPPEGYPEDSLSRQKTQDFLQRDILAPLTGFSGKIVFAPGVNEWNKAAPESIEDLEDFLQKEDQKDLWPDDGCPVENEELSEEVVLITVDSQWYLEEWDDHEEMNSDCQYSTREEFFTEFKDDLKDSQGKTIIVAVHHPTMSNTKIPLLEKLSGIGQQAYENPEYQTLRGRLETLASQFKDVIFVSGNHRNLQFLSNERNPQIISGSGSAIQAVKNTGADEFAAATKGFARLTVFEDGSSEVAFFAVQKGAEELLFSKRITRERLQAEDIDIAFPEPLSEPVSASIYSDEETEKSELYEWFWGEHYREVYGTEVTVPVLYLDSLQQNLRPIAEGGGQQSRSLRLINDQENEFTLRAMRKDPLQYIQADLVPDAYIHDFLDNTFAERVVSDFFTTAHPYAPFAVGDLLQSINIPHASRELYYLPKQEPLGIYNRNYGNALFMFEPHVGDENKNFEIFHTPDDILSTSDLLEELKDSSTSWVDQDAYIRARLFDMLIGDWDRHQDQWRWALHEEGENRRFVPIPRDRDHAFSTYDGFIIDIIKGAVPLMRKMQSYDGEIEDVVRFNWSGYPLDQRFIKNADWKRWEEQVKFIQNNVTDEVIAKAFSKLPESIQGEDLQSIQEDLKARRKNLMQIAKRYRNYLQEFQVLTGTSEDNRIEIKRHKEATEIIISEGKEELFRNSYFPAQTEEIWIYGLDGEDTIKVTGRGSTKIEIKALGGHENDVYDFQNLRGIRLYDRASSENTILNPRSNKRLVDSYEINHYHYLKRKYSENQILPSAGFEPDAGFTLGVKDVYTTFGLVRNPFTSRYTFEGLYFFASDGFSLDASAEFAHVFYGWNLGLEARYSSPNYSYNYFGWGNESSYPRESVEKPFHRVMMEEWGFAPSLIWRKETSVFRLRPYLQSVEVVHREGSFLAQNFAIADPIFSPHRYLGGEGIFHFINKNNASYPSLGSDFYLRTGYKRSLDEHDIAFGFGQSHLSFDYPLVSNIVVLASRVGGEVIFGDRYAFYDAADLGGNSNLRGYRNHRFNGEKSFFHSTDLRTALGLWKNTFLPIIYGVTAGFDYGRVWVPGEPSKEWHYDYGGSIWINALYAVTGNIGLYHGEDGNRVSVMLNFKF